MEEWSTGNFEYRRDYQRAWWPADAKTIALLRDGVAARFAERARVAEEENEHLLRVRENLCDTCRLLRDRLTALLGEGWEERDEERRLLEADLGKQRERLSGLEERQRFNYNADRERLLAEERDHLNQLSKQLEALVGVPARGSVMN